MSLECNCIKLAPDHRWFFGTNKNLTKMANSSLSEINPNDQIGRYKCGFLSEVTDISVHDTVINVHRHCTKRHDKDILLFFQNGAAQNFAGDC